MPLCNLSNLNIIFAPGPFFPGSVDQKQKIFREGGRDDQGYGMRPGDSGLKKRGWRGL